MDQDQGIALLASRGRAPGSGGRTMGAPMARAALSPMVMSPSAIGARLNENQVRPLLANGDQGSAIGIKS